MKLVIEEAEIEAGIMRDERCIAEKFEQLADLVGEARLVRQEGRAEPVNGSASPGMAGRVEIAVIMRPVSTRPSISTQPISTMRSPPPGLRPVVSVSKTISRIELSRHPSRGQDK
jgi:hypothetical protein